LADSIIHAQILINEADFKPNTNSTYYWFIKETIHCNMGGYSGHLLDGDYTVFGVDNHLLVQGRFSKGLKEDLWKYWDNNGNLIRTIRWNKGRLVAPSEHNAKRKISSIFIMNQLQTIR
jgi:antitoxin component YwqK of YwqJK toxin-antitoxin module